MSANESDTSPAPGASSKKSSNALIPIIVVILLVPALCYAVMEFLIVPKLKSSMGGGGDAHAKAADHGKAKGESHGGVKAPGEHTVEFGATVVNLAGSGNSRYLRTNFIIASSDKEFRNSIASSERRLSIKFTSPNSSSSKANPKTKSWLAHLTNPTSTASSPKPQERPMRR